MSRHAAFAAAALSLFGGVIAADVYPISLPPVAQYPAQTVTTADQVVYLPGCEKETRTHSYSDKTVTTTVPAEGCPTGWGKVEGCGSNMTPGGPLVVIYRSHVEWVEVYEKTVSCPYNEVGPWAYPGYHGSEYCAEGSDCWGKQTGYVKECYNGNCAAYTCYWGKDGVQHCDDYTKPSGYVPAPPGCEVVTAHYPQCFDGYCFLAEAYYTVPVVIGFPIVYPPGFCQKCLLPPGWGIITTLLPGYSTSTTMTIPTTTVTTTTTLTTGGTAIPTAGPLNCPEADRQVFVADSGSTFLIECNVGVTGIEIDARAEEISRISARALGTTGTFNGCIQLCDAIQSCEAVSYNPDTGVCRGFEDASVTANPNGDYVATVIRRAEQPSGTTTISATSTTQTPSPSDDLDARDIKREELVPKAHAKKAVRGSGRVERRAGRIVSPNVEKEKKDKIRL